MYNQYNNKVKQIHNQEINKLCNNQIKLKFNVKILNLILNNKYKLCNNQH